ncbi:hypothetical protein OSTOST_00915, partial [Ostertagia ostertagi]
LFLSKHLQRTSTHITIAILSIQRSKCLQGPHSSHTGNSSKLMVKRIHATVMLCTQISRLETARVNQATYLALSAKTQQSRPSNGIQAPSRVARTNTGNAPNQQHNGKTRNTGSTGHHQLVEVRLPRMAKKTPPSKNPSAPYQITGTGAAVHNQRRYPVRTIATQRITTPSPVRAEADTNTLNH